jgi:colanic acid/amylovoran biosynthesis glycosyltransferase
MKVLHLVRKNTHLNASFIINQIRNHYEFKPIVAFLEKRDRTFDGGFSVAEEFDFDVIPLGGKKNVWSKINYKVFKRISSKTQKSLMGLIRNYSPNVIHLHYGTDAGLYLPFLHKLNIPTFVSFYGYECSGFPKRFFGLGRWYLNAYVFKYASHVFAMSEDMKKDLVSLGCPEKKVIVHYYGTDVHHFYTQRNHQSKEIVRFLIISGFTPQKGHKYLIKAFSEAFKENNNIRLSIVGAGPLVGEIQNQVRELNLETVVNLPGAVVYGSDAHLAYFKSHDVFVHPSLTDVNGDKEGIPGAVVEAMAAGLPVITTSHAGIPYIIEDEKDGLLVPEKNLKKLKKCILRLAKDAELRQFLSDNAQRRALSELNLIKNEKNLEKHYLSAIENQKIFKSNTAN